MIFDRLDVSRHLQMYLTWILTVWIDWST
jgi:hypothetical protein